MQAFWLIVAKTITIYFDPHTSLEVLGVDKMLI